MSLVRYAVLALVVTTAFVGSKNKGGGYLRTAPQPGLA